MGSWNSYLVELGDLGILRIEFWPHFLGKKISFLALIECGVTFLFFYRNVRQAEPSKTSWVIEPAYNSVEKDKST